MLRCLEQYIRVSEDDLAEEIFIIEHNAMVNAIHVRYLKVRNTRVPACMLFACRQSVHHEDGTTTEASNS